MFEQLNFRVNYNDADYSTLVFPKDDKAVLRKLGETVAEIAARPVMKERVDLWKRHNALEATRPVILCDPENGWNEIIPGIRHPVHKQRGPLLGGLSEKARFLGKRDG